MASAMRRFTGLSSTTSTRRPGGIATSASSTGVATAPAGIAATTNGSVNPKVAPRPGSLSTASVPPMRWTSSRAMASPRPVPPWTRVVDVSACVNAVKSCACASGVMPIPVSRTSNLTRTRSSSTGPSSRSPITT